MKKILFVFLLLAIACKQKYDLVRKESVSKLKNPPGMVWLKDSIYIDASEIRNFDYLEYVQWIKRFEPEKYDFVLPDTTVWRNKKFCNEPYVQYYFSHPAYKNYPVVGVSYEQAIDFCMWRTKLVKQFASVASKRNKRAKKSMQHFQNIEYRLPTKEEWEYAASAGNLNSAFGYEKIIADNNLPKVWVKETAILYYYADATISTLTKTPNKFGLHNMIGNVAEMILDKGVSKGGSFINNLNNCSISDSILYTKPELWLGFRCVCVIKK